MTLIDASVGSLDLNASPYTVESFDLPDARLNDFGRSAQLGGAEKDASHYDDAPFEMVVIVTNPTRDALDNLTAAFTVGNDIVWAEGTGSASSTLTSVASSDPVLFEGFARVAFSGTRTPAWETSSTAFSLTITDGWGSAALPTFGGELCAKMSLSATCASASSLIALGVRPDPQAAYDPIDDRSGVSDATAFGGAKSSAVSLTASTPATLGTAPDIDVAANTGNHLAVARVESTATTARYRVGSDNGVAPIFEPYVTAANGTAALGMVRVPAYDLPPNTADGAWVAATGISQTAGTVVPFQMQGRYVGQTFTLTETRRVKNLRFRSVQAPAGGYIRAGTFGSILATFLGAVAVGSDWWQFSNLALVLPSGTYSMDIRFPLGAVTPYRATDNSVYSGGKGYFYDTILHEDEQWTQEWVAGDGTDATIDWAFEIDLEEELAFSAQTPVQAYTTESSKTAAIDVLARIPADNGWFLAQGSFGAGTGVFLDADLKRVYPYSAAGVTGAALDCMMPTPPSPVPGVENHLVVACSAIDDVTVTGTITERRIHRG